MTEGRFKVAICGPPMAGKFTLLRAIAAAVGPVPLTKRPVGERFVVGREYARGTRAVLVETAPGPLFHWAAVTAEVLESCALALYVDRVVRPC